MKKLLSVLLLLLSISVVLTSCNPNSGASATTSAQSEASGAVSGEESGTNTYTAKLPDGVNYGGETVTILTTAFSLTNLKYSEFGFGEEREDNTINNAVDERNAFVEEQLGIKLVEECLAETERFNGGALNTRVINALQSGSDNFYICSPSLYNCAVLAESNCFYDLMDFEYLHGLSEPWWDQNFVEDISIGGRLFFVTGDMGLNSKNSVSVCYFNKNLFASYNLGDPYELVREKKWTFDKLIQISKTVSQDLDNNNTIDYLDQYGVGGQNDCMWAMFYGSGERLAAKDQDNMPKITIYNEKSVNVVDKILELMTNDNYFVNANYYWSVSDTPVDLIVDGFLEGRSLMYVESLGTVEDLREMAADIDFGILPIPLYSEEDDNYQHMINPWGGSGFAIPKYLEAEKAEMASVVMEALGAASKNILVPAYFEIALKNQKTRDTESQETLDIIFATMGSDMGHVYNWGKMGYMLHRLVEGKLIGQLTSEFEKIKDATQTQIDETVELFSKIQ